MGLRPVYADGLLSAQVFLADALDNGAGYASELGRPEVFKRILDEARQDLADAGRPAPFRLYRVLSGLPAVL